MSFGRGRTWRRTLAALALGAVALVSATALAAPAAAAPAAPGAVLPFDAGGQWTDFGVAKPRITVVGGSVFVDMSYAGRRNATGRVLDASRIEVTFSDDNVLLGTFTSPTRLDWSNGSTWLKVYTGAQLFDVEGQWGQTGLGAVAHVGQGGGFFDVVLLSSGLHAAGFATGPSSIRVTFPGNDVQAGTLGTGSREQPFDERVHQHLMLALYRVGRQVDALGVYRALRSALSTDLGIAPSPALRELEAAILRHDPVLDGGAVRSSAGSTPGTDRHASGSRR